MDWLFSIPQNYRLSENVPIMGGSKVCKQNHLVVAWVKLSLHAANYKCTATAGTKGENMSMI